MRLIVASKLRTRFAEINKELWGQASWFEHPDHAGNLWTSPQYVKLLGRSCKGYDWIRNVLNKEYVISYLEWRSGTSEKWVHDLIWNSPTGTKFFEVEATRLHTGAIQGVVRNHE